MDTNGATLLLRQLLYFERQHPDINVNKPLMTQMCILWQLLQERKSLYLSIEEMIGSKYYQYWKRRPKQLYDCFEDLVRKGYMVRSSRVSKRDKGCKVIIWGLTGKGKTFIRTYYEYLDGTRDSELFDTGHLVGQTA